MNAIEIRGLEKRYPGFDLKLDLTLPQGCILGLVGENGAGKSTTIKAILGMLRPDAGSIRVLGQDNSRAFAPVRERIGVVLDEPGFPDCLTAEQLGTVMAGIYRNWESEVYAAFLKKLAVPEAKPYKEFSRGMRMKLAIAVALSHKAELLVLDEPTSGLDPVVRDEVVELFSEFTRDEGHAVLISSHIVSDLEKLCDYIAFLCEEKDALCEEYGLAQLSAADFAALDPAAVVGSRRTPYGVTAIVRREALPEGFEVEPVSLEDLFVVMVKGEENA